MSILQPGGLLIVDPNRIRSRRISEAFERQWGGAVTDRADNARDARRRLESDPPGFVLAHASLPSHEVRDLVRACTPRTRLFLLQNPEENPWPVSYVPGRDQASCEVLTDDAEALPVQVEMALFTATEPMGAELMEGDLIEGEPLADDGGTFDFDDEPDGDGSGWEPDDESSRELLATAWDLQRKLFEKLPVACCVFGDDGELVYVNPAWVGGAEQPALGDCHTDESPYQHALEHGQARVPLSSGNQLVFESFDVPFTNLVAVSAQIAPDAGDELSPNGTYSNGTGANGTGANGNGASRSTSIEPASPADIVHDEVTIYDWSWNLLSDRFELHPEWIHRLELQEPPDRVAGFEACIEPDDLPRVRRTIRDHLARGAEHFEVRFSLRTDGGHVLPCESLGQVLRFSAAGEPELLGGRLRPLACGWETTLVPHESAGRGLAASGNPLWSGAKHVLFVDDEESILRLARAQLQRLGYEATTCADAEAALRHLELHRFDAVVTDERLPGMSGRELAARLDTWEDAPAVVLTTGFAPAKTADLGRGIAQVLEKPYDLEGLARALLAAFGQSARA